MVIFVCCLGIIFLGITYIQAAYLKGDVRKEEETRFNLIQGEYRQSMDEYTEDSLLKLSIWAADKTDDEFWIVAHDMQVLGLQVEDVFRHPENYHRIPVSGPKKENAGKYVLQLLCPNGESPIDGLSDDFIFGMDANDRFSLLRFLGRS